MNSIVWFRRDLRLADNPALWEAAQASAQLIPLYIYSPEEEGNWAPGGAAKWWLYHALESLDNELHHRESRLILQQGNPLEILQEYVRIHQVTHIYWNRCYEPSAIIRDEAIIQHFSILGIMVHAFNGSLLHEPWDNVKQDRTPFQVFTPFWRRNLTLLAPTEPIPAPKTLPKLPALVKSLTLKKLKLLPTIHWEQGLQKTWTPGRIGAEKALQHFLDDGLLHYSTNRDIPELTGTSRMAPYLHHGELSPREVWYAINQHEMHDTHPGVIANAEVYQRQLGWREFAYHLMYHYPHTPEKALRAEYDDFPWSDDYSLLQRWQQGTTGYPIVDAGMRELIITGWMHNRVRMIVASFLVKDLLLPWQEGAQWFWDTLVDADMANNTMGWQWAGGCGADAAPYFRIFNPVLQGEKFDPLGTYVRRYIPELVKLPNEYIHQPWSATDAVLKSAGVKLDDTYPRPVIDHAFARERALTVLAQWKRNKT